MGVVVFSTHSFYKRWQRVTFLVVKFVLLFLSEVDSENENSNVHDKISQTFIFFTIYCNEHFIAACSIGISPSN